MQTPELSMNLYKIGTFVHFYCRFLIVKALVGAFNKKEVPPLGNVKLREGSLPGLV